VISDFKVKYADFKESALKFLRIRKEPVFADSSEQNDRSVNNYEEFTEGIPPT
jgi:hypothetical protein